MRVLLPWHIDYLPWYAFGGYWAITWLRVKRTKETEKSADRLITVGVIALAFVLMFYRWPPIAAFDLRFVPAEPLIAYGGVLLASLGAAVAIWARYCLGQNWSARVTLKEGHRLIRSGPYRWVRHPIYTGMLLGAVGRAFTVGELRAVVGVLLILAAHSRKAAREEGMLTREFGEEYTAYRHSTGFLFPRLRRAGMDYPAARS